MIYQKLTGILSICRKAGRMAVGFDPMLEALRSGKVRGVVTVSDISPKTYKEVCYHCGSEGIPVVRVPMTMLEFGAAIGRKAAVAGILDDGFFRKIQEICQTQTSQERILDSETQPAASDCR